MVDIDDTIVEVHGYAKQDAEFGYAGVLGLNGVIATVSTQSCAPVIVAQRLRKGSANSARGAQRLVRDALKTVRTLAQGESRTGSGPPDRRRTPDPPLPLGVRLGRDRTQDGWLLCMRLLSAFQGSADD